MRHGGGAAREWGFERGDWVFVHPGEGSAPSSVRGLSGRVVDADGDRVTVEFRRDGGPVEVDVAAEVLRAERRRRDRPPAAWSPPVARSA
ncbi:MAG TPA: hypothetical protein VGC78_12835 [Gaiellaceae bacterium]|jgi:hypothetical protein